MEKDIKQTLQKNMEQFHMPRYHELPDSGLFLDQTVQLINSYLKTLEIAELTSSMISNYVKQHYVSAPVKKLYKRDHIAYLIYITVAKNVLSLDEIKRFIEHQMQTYNSETAYNYFCMEFENVLQYVFGNKDSLDVVGVTHTDTKNILRSMIFSVSYKIHIQKYLKQM